MTNNANTRPAAGDEKNDNGGLDDQGKPVKVNAAATEQESRDIKRPDSQDANRKMSPVSPALDDEEVDHSAENDFRYHSQKPGSDESAGRSL